MLSNTTIYHVRQLSALQVIERYVTLKKKGANYQGLSPFTNEKTPSFYVVPAKNIYKCFSSGKGGDAISFVMEKEGIAFIEAVKSIAQQHHIAIEYEEVDSEERERRQKEETINRSLRQLLAFAHAYFASNEVPDDFLKSRRLRQSDADRFGLGYAPQAPRAFYELAKQSGYTTDLLIRAGLVRQVETSNGLQYYDYFQDRIMFPIRSPRGEVVAFTGRLAHPVHPEADYKPPKYLNSPDTCYNKSEHLYGLYEAMSSLQQLRGVDSKCYVVEGPTDVLALSVRGHGNVVAPCGSGFTTQHAKLLQRFTTTVCVIPDKDVAGMKALHRTAEVLIKAGLDVEVLQPEKENSDPDSYIRSMRTDDELQAWLNGHQHYLTGLRLNMVLAVPDGKTAVKTGYIRDMVSLLSKVPNDVDRKAYYNQIVKDWSEFKEYYKLVKKEEGGIVPVDDLSPMQVDSFKKYGIWAKNNKLYSYSKDKEIIVAYFNIETLFFIINGAQPRYLVQLTNDYYQRLTTVTTDDLTAMQQFDKTVARKGAYTWAGERRDLIGLRRKLTEGVREAQQPEHLGYETSVGFYTWANGLFYQQKFYEADEHGMVTLPLVMTTMDEVRALPPQSQVRLGSDDYPVTTPKELIEELGEYHLEEAIRHENLYRLQFYYLPYSVGSQQQYLIMPEEDYENERKFIFKQQEGIAFDAWATLMQRAYGEKASLMVAYYVAALFRDLIFQENNNWFPLLFLFGRRESGKSTAARSLAKMFGDGESDGINLESGSTHTGIRRYMNNMNNGLVWLNEYKNTLRPDVIGMLKGIADGSGKITGVKTEGNQIKSYRPKNAVVCCGQDLPTIDFALFTRCITLEFDGTRYDRSAYTELVDHEQHGRTQSITNALQGYRSLIAKHYQKYQKQVIDALRSQPIPKNIEEMGDRYPLNMASAIAPVKILMDFTDFNFPFSYQELIALAHRIVVRQIETQQTSDDVERFFSVLQSCVGRGFNEGTHWKITRDEQGRNVLMLRFRAAHAEYRNHALRQGIVPLDESVVKRYLLVHALYLDDTKNTRFSGLVNPTSAMVIDYDKLCEWELDFATTETVGQPLGGNLPAGRQGPLGGNPSPSPRTPF